MVQAHGVWLAALAGLISIGCQANQARWRPLTPFGTTRVPPPPTGAFGTADGYYQTPSPPVSLPTGNSQSLRLPPATSTDPPHATGTRSNLADSPAEPRTSSTGETDVSRGNPRNLLTEEPLRWVDPYHLRPDERPTDATRSNSSVVAPLPSIREPTPTAGGKTVIRLSYEEDDGRSGIEILTPTPAWSNRAEPTTGAAREP